MKLQFTIILMTLMATNALQAQYSETFDVPNKGILEAPCTTNDPATCASSDFAGVDWMLGGDLSGLDNSEANFYTFGGVLRAKRLREEICWLSPVLNMTGTASFAMDLTWLQFDDYVNGTPGSQDYIDVSYRIDDGSWVTLPNAVGGGPRTISYGTTPPASNVDGSISGLGASGLTGSTLQIRVCVDVNSAQEIVTLDNVSAVNATTGTSGPVCDLVLNNTTKTDEDCPGANDGTITVNATTTNGPITYTLSGPVNASNQTGIFANLPPGNYSVALQDGSFAPGTCTANTGPINIAAGVDSNPPSGQVQPIVVDCPDDIPGPDITEVTNVDDNCMIPCVTEPWINEFHYDNIGTDVNEFIEVAGPAGIDLSLYELYTYDGFNGAVDQIFALSGIIPDQDNGFGAAFVLTPNLQNTTEGIALVKNGATVIEFISYEGVVTATDGPANGMTSVDVGVSESNTTTPANGSLGRIGNGNKPGDFTWAVLTQTQGTLNTGQTISDCPDNEPTVAHLSDTDNGGAASAGNPYIVTRTYRITDAAGNTADVTQTLTANNCCPTYTDNIAYVNLNATGANNGTSWTDAFTDLQDALNSACPGISEIWVAAGTYKPSEDPFGNTSPADPRDKTFYVRDGISIYGGFAGNETTLSERNIAANTTTLSGDFNGDDVVTGNGATLSITNNTENAYHVVISSGSTGVTIDGFTVTGGNANGTSTIEVNGASIPRAGGGGIYAREGTNTLTNNTLFGNYAREGGGISTSGGINTMTDNTLLKNLASSGGGISTGAGTNTLSNNTVSGNKANSNGGGIFTIFGANILTNNNFSGNSAAYGGGIYAREGTNTLTDNTLSVNTASNSGGGMYNDDSSPTITTSIFSGNEAVRGGGMFNSGSSPTLTGVTFSNNSANGAYGGGMYNSGGSNPNLTNVSFISNSAYLGGGGMSNSSSSPTVTNSTFSGNSAPVGQRGGGMYNGNSSPTVTNSIFSSNAQDGMYNESGSSPLVTNSIFWGSGFSGIYNSSSSPSVTNCIIWSNSSGGIFDDNSTPTVNYSIVQGGYTGTNNLNTDPLFVNAAGGDFRLTVLSPALNAGDPATNLSLFPGGPGNPEDLDGNPRVVGAVIDMGAYESQVICPSGNVLYVNTNTTGDNNGNSWADAFTDLQDALNSTCPGITEIWVAAGTYQPALNSSFSMKEGVAILGGFPNTGNPGIDQRNYAINTTILQGNGTRVINNNNNGLTNAAVLDGFTITGGSTPGDHGPGAFNRNVSPTFRNCIFTGNTGYWDGSLFLQNGSAIVTNCVFLGNTGAVYTGGINVSWNGSNTSPVITNCSFSGNSGPGIYCGFNTTAVIRNSVIWGNDDGIYLYQNANPTVTNSIVQGGFTGSGNLDIDPLFVNQPAIGLGTSGDLRLQSCSPAINAGDNASVPSGIITDLDGNPRFYNSGTVDMGAYEYQGEKHVNPTDGGLIASSQTLCSGEVPDPFTSILAPTGFVGDLEYQWQISTSSPTFVDISGANTDTYTHSNTITQTTWFRRLAKVTCENDWVASNVVQVSVGPERVYVTVTGAGLMDGSSWANAMNGENLQTAINLACDEVWVATGTYKPTTGSDRTISFVMKNGVAIYGGFAGTEDPLILDLADRDFVSNETILSGDLLGDDGPDFANYSDNSYHVIRNSSGIDNTAILDGFTISGGNADGSGAESLGGGMLNSSASPRINNCTFTKNSSAHSGGAIYVYYGVVEITSSRFIDNYALYVGGAISTHANIGETVNLTLSDCSFSNNSCTYGGGAINHGYGNSAGTGLFSCTNCTFTDNVAYNGSNSGGGGAFFNEALGFDGMFVNCLFDGNKGLGNDDWGGGTFLLFEGNCTIINSTIVNSESGTVGGAISVWSENSTLELTNSILWNNSAATSDNSIFNGNGGTANVQFSLIQEDACPANLNCEDGLIYGLEPRFESQVDFSLQACSPVINAGDGTSGSSANATTEDLADNPRFYNGGIVDMGAYEYQGEKHVNPTDGGLIASSQTLCSGEVPDPFTSLSAPTGFVGDLEYQWQLNTISATASFNDWEDVGTNTDTYDHLDAITQTTWFRRLARVGCVTDTWETAASSNVLEITTFPFGLRTWTGTTDSDWNTASNWDPPCVPTAADDVIIPDVTNDPVIYAGIAAVAKSVTVNEDASLDVEATGSLTINGSAIHEFDSYAGLYNRGTVTNDGLISLGAVSSVGEIGLWNIGTFTNTGEIQIDRSTLVALWSSDGQFTNEAIINMGDLASVADYGLYNDATFVNTVDGQIQINNFTFRGIENRTGEISNSGNINIGQTSNSGQRSIMNQAVFNHIGGEISLDRSTAAGIFNDGSGLFTNAALLNIGGTVSVGQYGIQNIGTFTNTLDGEIFIDRTAVMGLFNNGGGSKFINAAMIAIGTTASVGLLGVGNEGNFNNLSGGEITIDRTTQVGFSSVAPVTNSGLMRIGSVESVGPRGLQNVNSVFTNTVTGEIHIDKTIDLAVFNADAQFVNNGKMILGANHPIGARGINNQGASNSFLNSATGEITIDRTTEYAFVNSYHTNENAGKLTIGSHATVDGYGIFLFFSAGLNNTGAGEIRIDRTTNSGIYVEAGNTFTNDATIIIGEAEPYTSAYGIQNEGIFTNGPCAVIRMYAPLSNLTTFTNNGLLTAITTEPHAGIAVVVNSPGGVAGAYNFAAAGFGGDVGGGVWTADAVLVSDAGASSLGCNAPYQNAGDLAGKIALIDRGTCYFSVKAYNAQLAGAIAVVIINNVPGPAFVMGAGTDDPITIPCVLISKADGDAIKAAGNVNMSIGNIATPANAIINNGILEFPLGNSIPSIENNQVVVEPFGGDCSAAISPALRLDDEADFLIAETWYFDENLTNVAGTYDMGTNTFVPDGALAGDVTTLYFNITDPVGGCTRTVSVQASFNDDLIPDAVCKNIIVELVGSSVTVFAADVDDGSTDNCTLAEELIFTPASVTYTCADLGVNTFVLTVTDAKGNSNFCIALVTVVDVTPPQINCPDPVEVLTDPFENFASNVIIGVATGTDNCGVPDIEGVRSDALALNDPYPVGLTTIIWTATDIAGLTVSCTQMVTVIKRYGLQLEAILQGPYQPNRSNGVMSTALNQGNQLPDNQPYNTAPWYYDGEETLSYQLPEEVVDWLLVELRSDEETFVAQRAGLLYNDGNLFVSFEGDAVDNEEYFIVLYHRNHMPVMSSHAIPIPVEGTSFDFTQLSNVYLGGAIPLGTGRSSHVGMIAGDVSGDGILKYSGPGNDRGLLLGQIVAEGGNLFINPTNGYWTADGNMNNELSYQNSNNDRSIIIENIGLMTGNELLTSIYESVVPGIINGQRVSKPRDDGPVNIRMLPEAPRLSLVLLTTTPIHEGVLDNMQFSLAWQTGDTEMALLVQSYSSDYGLQAQGEVVTHLGISYQTFAMALPLQLPANWLDEQLSVLEFTSEAYANIHQRLWVADDDYTANNNAMYYISIWGTDHTGQIMGTAVSVVEQLTDYSIRLYPNPVNQARLNLAFRGIKTQELEMHIMDAKGKQVMAERFEASAQQTKTINIQHLQPGVYVLQLRSSKLVYQQKFVVVR